MVRFHSFTDRTIVLAVASSFRMWAFSWPVRERKFEKVCTRQDYGVSGPLVNWLKLFRNFQSWLCCHSFLCHRQSQATNPVRMTQGHVLEIIIPFQAITEACMDLSRRLNGHVELRALHGGLVTCSKGNLDVWEYACPCNFGSAIRPIGFQDYSM